MCGLSQRELRALALRAADYAFLPDDEKAALRRRMQAALATVTEDSEEDAEQEVEAAADGAAVVTVAAPQPKEAARPRSGAGGAPAGRPRFSWRSLWVRS